MISGKLCGSDLRTQYLFECNWCFDSFDILLNESFQRRNVDWLANWSCHFLGGTLPHAVMALLTTAMSLLFNRSYEFMGLRSSMETAT